MIVELAYYTVRTIWFLILIVSIMLAVYVLWRTAKE